MRAVETRSFSTGKKKRIDSKRTGMMQAKKLDFSELKGPQNLKVLKEEVVDHLTNANDSLSDLEKNAVLIAIPNDNTPIKGESLPEKKRASFSDKKASIPAEPLYESAGSVRPRNRRQFSLTKLEDLEDESRSVYAYSNTIKELASATVW